MVELLDKFADTSFIDTIIGFAPAVGVGLILGIICALVGWLWGFVIRLGRFEP